MNDVVNRPAVHPAWKVDETRVDRLVASLSLDQKIGQMLQTERMAVGPEEVRRFHIGSLLSGAGSRPGDNTPSDWVAMNDAYWEASMTAEPAIPLIYGVDAVHGNNNVRGATIFPHNIGLGCTRDPELLGRIARVTAREVLACGLEWTFAPTLAVAQDYRWGRTYESYSSDPALVGELGAAFVNGLQGDCGDDGVVACAKHWVGDGGTGHGIDQGDTRIDPEELERTHIAPYQPVVAAGALSVMVSFNSWNGDKCHAHYRLLTEVLKGRMAFHGLVISDWDGIDYLSDDYTEAVAMAANAGIDLFMVSEAWQEFMQAMRKNVDSGVVPMARINDAVRRILTVKSAYGLFERPRPTERPWSGHASFGSPEHREVAREAVRKSLVLLKNENELLPLDRGARILVAGKNANNTGHQCGGFSVDWQGMTSNEGIEGGTSIWQGIQGVAPNATLSPDGSAADAGGFELAIVVIGETPYAEGMGDVRDGDHMVIQAGSRIRGTLKVLEAYGRTLDLAERHPEDLACIRRIADQGIPVVTVLISGRPLLVNPELDRSDAFVAAWLPGSEGQGVADVLFGDHDFEGRLSFDWPAHSDDLNCLPEQRTPRFQRNFGLRMRC